jgi:hypothetical protein
MSDENQDDSWCTDEPVQEEIIFVQADVEDE